MQSVIKVKHTEHGREHTLVMIEMQPDKKAKSFPRKAKRLFEKGIALQSKRNPKASWAHARKKLRIKCGVSSLLADVKDKDSLKFNDEGKANILQDQFSSVYTQELEDDMLTIAKRTCCGIGDLHVIPEMGQK